MEDIERINSPQTLYRSWSERKNRVLSAHLGSILYYQPT